MFKCKQVVAGRRRVGQEIAAKRGQARSRGRGFFLCSSLSPFQSFLSNRFEPSTRVVFLGNNVKRRGLQSKTSLNAHSALPLKYTYHTDRNRASYHVLRAAPKQDPVALELRCAVFSQLQQNALLPATMKTAESGDLVNLDSKRAKEREASVTWMCTSCLEHITILSSV